jgi:CBS domain-containing protein
LDLGTNGEIFLGNSKRMMSCSAAAGPALEGARISEGMIAKAGAIEGVSFEEGDIHYLVVGNILPRGICGSGLVELISVLLKVGIIDHEGLIRPTQKRTALGLNSRLIDRSGVYDFLIASAEESYDHKPLYLTQRDVRELQLAKGAIAAGIKTLTDEMGIRPEDIDLVYLAGALGNYINPDSAMRIGLIPTLDSESVRSLGNAASMGASLALLSRNYWQRAEEVANFIEHIELSSRLDFNQYFIEQIDFPIEIEADMLREDMDVEVMRKIKVKEVMTSNFLTVSSAVNLEEMSNMLRDTGYRGLPVLDEKGRLFGMVTLIDLEHSLQKGNAELKVGDIATRELFVAYDDQSLSDVIRAIPKSYGRIPVVDRHDKGRLVGVLRRRDIIRAYRKGAAQARKKSGAGVKTKKSQ